MSQVTSSTPSLRVTIGIATGAILIAPVAVTVVWTAVATPQFSWRDVIQPVGLILVTYGALAIVVASVLSQRAVATLQRLATDIDTLDSASLTYVPGEPIEMRDVRLSVRRRVSQSEIAARQLRATAAAILHDLKAPVVGIRNVLQLIRVDNESVVEVDANLLIRLTAETEALAIQVTRGVNVLRLLSEEELGSLSRVDARMLVEKAVLRVGRSGASINVAGCAEVTCDVQLMSRALFNLIDNAARHARSTVIVEVHNGLVRIADDGHGLPAPLAELVHPFRSSGDPAQSGTSGLGLAMAKRALEAHGGSLTVERTDEHGTILLAYLGHQFERMPADE